MNIITRIEIVNFRSIERLILENGLSDLNIIVGNNDAGKSNVLRALNLFFNGNTDLNTPFDFSEDFNKNIYRADRRSKYVKVVLDIKLKYERNKYLRWSKLWDMDSNLRDNIWNVYNIDTEEEVDFIDRSRAQGWLGRLKYRYVPAVKGLSYFQHLYEELHDVLAKAYSEQFSQDSGNFISGIQNVTEAITEELQRELGIPNRISISSDFKALFSALDFSLDSEQGTYYLSKRGDGIKARHIPVILKYLADNEYRSLQGSTSVDTIWGFEEPENNLEMSHAFKMATSFLGYSNQLQIFLTTHSPAFYALKHEEVVKKWFIKKNETGNTEAIKITGANEVDLDFEMGMLAYVTPFVDQKNKELQALRAEQERLERELQTVIDRTKCLVFTEDEQNESELMKKLLDLHNFNMEETEVRCYYGKGNLKPAIMAADIAKERMSNLERVIFHRDRDTDGDGTVAWVTSELQKTQRNDYRYFLTANYDIESYFINASHINHLYPELNIEIIEQRIVEATEAVKEKSLSRIVNTSVQEETKHKIHKEEKPLTSINFYKMSNEAIKMYEENVERYRYGKKVLSRLIGLLQEDMGNNMDIVRASPYLVIPELQQVRQELWPD